MDNDILFFFREHMDAPPIYERLENAILTRTSDVKIEVATHPERMRPKSPALSFGCANSGTTVCTKKQRIFNQIVLNLLDAF